MRAARLLKSQARFEEVTSKDNLRVCSAISQTLHRSGALVRRPRREARIERASSILMPVFALVLLVLLAFAIAEGPSARRLSFLTRVRPKTSPSPCCSMLWRSPSSPPRRRCRDDHLRAYLKTDADVPRSSPSSPQETRLVALVAALVVFSLVVRCRQRAGRRLQPAFVNLPIGLAQCRSATRRRPILPAGAVCSARLVDLADGIAVSWLDERTGVTRVGRSARRASRLRHWRGYIYSREYPPSWNFGVLAAYAAGGFLIAGCLGLVLEKK